MSRSRLRDSVYRPSVARAITSPAGMMAGSVASAGVLATGAPVAVAVIAGALAWAVPVIRAVRSGGTGLLRRKAPTLDELPQRWKVPVADAEDALWRYRRALRRCPAGPLHDRMEEMESEFTESVARCAELARWGAEAEAARAELDPGEVERAARDAGRPAGSVADDQRDVIERLQAVARVARARLVLINGRLDEAVGRAVEMSGRAGRVGRGDADSDAFDLGAGALATELRDLRSALDEVESLGSDHRRRGAPDPQRRARSAD